MAREDAAVVGRGWQLEQHVLTWSIEDIINDHLLLGKVRPIPTTFPDIPSYLAAFCWPLLEECRAGLMCGLEHLPAAASTRLVLKALQGGDGRMVRAGAGECGCEGERDDDWQQQSVNYSDDVWQDQVHGIPLYGSEANEIAPCMASHGQLMGRFRADLAGARTANTAHCDAEGFCYRRFEVLRQPAGTAGTAGTAQWEGAASLKPTDVVLLSTMVPTRPTDLLRPGVLYRLAVLLAERNLPAEDGDGDHCFRARICAPEDSLEYRGLFGAVNGGKGAGGASWYVTLVGSFATAQRVWGALHESVLESGDLGEGGTGQEVDEVRWRQRIFRGLLCSEQRAGHAGLRPGIRRGGGEERERAATSMPTVSIAPEQIPHLMQAVLEFCTSRHLIHPQQSAAPTCLRGLLSATTAAAPTSNFSFLLGSISPFSSSLSFPSPHLGAAPHLLQLVQCPPGTGKIHTLSVLLSVALSLGVRTLICASTNVAAAEVARRMLCLALSPDPSSHFPGFCQAQQQWWHPYGCHFQFEMAFPSGGRLHVGDIALVANEDRLVVDLKLDLILLGKGRTPGAGLKGRKGSLCCGRVGRLLAALSLQCGWRASVLTLMRFLEALEEEMSHVHPSAHEAAA